MPYFDSVTHALRGHYRDRLYHADGTLAWDRGWSRNKIVTSCRHLLAGFMLGQSNTLGISGLLIGRGSPSWDQTLPPEPDAGVKQLVDPHPHTVPGGELQIEYLDPSTGSVSATPTNRIQIQATVGPGVPPWPDANHTDSTLREFGLIGRLNDAEVLINYVIHPAIVKDALSTLERTIWLVF